MTVEEILAGESKNIEFKIQRPKDSIKYMKTVVAFANGEGGRIVFGVDDKTHDLIDTNFLYDNNFNKIKKQIADNTTDNISFIESGL